MNIVKQGNDNRLCVLSNEEKEIWDRVDAQGSTIFKQQIEIFLAQRKFQYKSDDDSKIAADIDSMSLIDKAKTKADIRARRRRS